VTHLRVAESISKGIGIGIIDVFGQFKPSTGWPPLYSVMLSLFFSLSSIFDPQISVEQISRWMGMFLSAATIWVFGLLIAKISNKSIGFVAAGVVVLISSPIFWSTYLYGTPEPLFVLLSLLSIYFFLEYMRTFSQSTLFWAGLYLGLSSVTCYVGFYLIPVMAVSMFFFTHRPIKRNFFALGKVSVLGAFPVFIWGLRNYTLTGSPASQKLGFVPMRAQEWDLFRSGFMDWFSPATNLFKIIPLGIATLLAVLLLSASLILYYKKRVYGNNESQEMWWKILIIYLLSYSFFIVFLKLFFDPALPVYEARIFIPVYIGILLFIISLLANAREIKYLVLGKYLYYAAFGVMIVFGVVFATANTQRTYAQLANSHNDGLGLNSSGFINSPVSVFLKYLSSVHPVYFTDNAEKLYWINKQPSAALLGIDQSLGRQFQQYLPEHDIIIVLMDHAGASPDIIRYIPSAQKIYAGEDGAILIVRRPPAN
jgi:hypothetical protein